MILWCHWRHRTARAEYRQEPQAAWLDVILLSEKQKGTIWVSSEVGKPSMTAQYTSYDTKYQERKTLYLDKRKYKMLTLTAFKNAQVGVLSEGAHGVHVDVASCGLVAEMSISTSTLIRGAFIRPTRQDVC